jgi:hypothetical protein
VFLAETVFQQQEGTLLSIESTLTFIGFGLLALLVVTFIIGTTLARTNRIARATYDLLKELLALEKQKAQDAIDAAAKAKGNEERAMRDRAAVVAAVPRKAVAESNTAAADVYRID